MTTETLYGYTLSGLEERYEYNPDTGIVINRKGPRKGLPVGGVNKTHGYLNTCLTKPDGKVTTAAVHRIAWALHHKQIPDPKLVIDHINGDILDNKADNIRLVTQKENCRNASKRRPKKNPNYITTEIPGIRICRKTGNYIASGGSNVLVETMSFDDAKYVRWNWEYDNGYHVNHGTREINK